MAQTGMGEQYQRWPGAGFTSSFENREKRKKKQRLQASHWQLICSATTTNDQPAENYQINISQTSPRTVRAGHFIA